jgi:hypothetical protein
MIIQGTTNMNLQPAPVIASGSRVTPSGPAQLIEPLQTLLVTAVMTVRPRLCTALDPLNGFAPLTQPLQITYFEPVVAMDSTTGLKQADADMASTQGHTGATLAMQRTFYTLIHEGTVRTLHNGLAISMLVARGMQNNMARLETRITQNWE